MNYGTNLMIKKGSSSGMAKKGKDKPRCGAAMGQGMGMGGLDQGRVSKAMGMIPGDHGGKPMFYCAGMKK